MSDEDIKRLGTILVDEGDNSRLEIEAAEISVKAGPDKGERLVLGAESVLIGSSPECNLVLHDKTVSTRHAEIVAGPRGYVVRDLGSTNGVFCGNQPIERAPLVDGMRLRLGKTQLAVRSLGHKEQLSIARPGELSGLIAHSLKMRAVAAQLAELAQSDVSVLLEGETGTGKEVAAHAIHAVSPRRHGPFIVFDCGAVASSLAAAELFGHEKGAFTGATTARAGLFEDADGGTLFLDEVGELPLELQPLLLGALERKVSRRIGGKTDVHHDVRIVAATNRNLAEEVREKRFRRDLFFRLAVARVRLPPLRERREDVPILAARFASELGATLPAGLVAHFSHHEWPGNVRELRNVVGLLAAQPDALLNLAPAGADRHHPFLDATGQVRPLQEARRGSVEDFERRYIEFVLERAGGNVSQAAELAGISRQMLQRLGGRYGLRPSDRGR